ncbi:hypothetical protein, partial [Neorhizobium vignae]|uniref:hypothetical protein n=1 Tax=Neorhizobium vignae TaxID=690585 RepID=UPI001A9A4682
LIDAYRQDSREEAIGTALVDAPREPLTAAHWLIELLELLTEAPDRVIKALEPVPHFDLPPLHHRIARPSSALFSSFPHW